MTFGLKIRIIAVAISAIPLVLMRVADIDAVRCGERSEIT